MARADTTITSHLSTPRWLARPRLPENLAPFPAKVDASLFTDKDAVTMTLTANAAQNAVALTITAITLPKGITKIPKGTLIHFGGAKIARLDADYTSGTSVTVLAIPTAMVIGDSGVYLPYGTRVAIPEGTLMGRTYAERAADAGFGPWATGDDEVFLSAYDIVDANKNNNVEFIKHGVEVKENYLPNFTVLSALVDEVQTVTITGTLSAGTFTFHDPRSGETSTPVAYNGNLAAIQAALDEIYGASNSVAAGTIASFTITFAAALAGIDMPPIVVTPDGVTGLTGINVAQTTGGGSGWLAKVRELYIPVLGKD